MDLIDSKYVDVKIAEGKIVVEVPLIELLKEAALKSGNKIDDALVEFRTKTLTVYLVGG